MNKTVRVMRLQMGGSWTAHELGHFLRSIGDLYNLRLILEVLKEDWRDLERMWDEMMHFPPIRKRWMRRGTRIPPQFLFGAYPLPPAIPGDSEDLMRLAQVVYPSEVLEVHQIQYGSPGATDLAGLAAIVGHVKEFILRLIDHWVERRERRIKEEKLRAKVDAIRMENARNFVELAEECGYDRSEFRQLVGIVDTKQEIIYQVIAEAKLEGVHMLDSDGQLPADDNGD